MTQPGEAAAATASPQSRAPRRFESRLGNLWRGDHVLLALLAAGALLGLIYNFAIMPGYGPDEPRHFNYVKLLLEEHRLPVLQSDGQEYHGAHTYHPPLYYLYEAPFYLLGGLLPGAGRWHMIRLGSLLLCLASLPLAYDIARRAMSGSRTAARLATAILALLPIFGMTGGIINNDSATMLACILFVWLLVRYPLFNSTDCGGTGSGGTDSGLGLRAALVLGVVFGLGALCKGSVLLADAAALFTAFWLGRRGALPLTTRLRHLAVVLLLAGAIAAPWYLRNRALYGSLQPIPQGYTIAALPKPSAGVLTMMMHDNFPPLLLIANKGIFISQWSQIDWIPQALRAPVYLSLFGFCALAALGLMLSARRARQARRHAEPGAAPARGKYLQAGESLGESPEEPESSRESGLIALAPYPMMWISCLYIAMFVHWGQAEGGRYLLPAFAGFGVWLAAGWQVLAGEGRLKIVLVLWCVAMLALNAVAVYWLLAYLNPTYGPQP